MSALTVGIGVERTFAKIRRIMSTRPDGFGVTLARLAKFKKWAQSWASPAS
jgi:hypothetical protein